MVKTYARFFQWIGGTSLPKTSIREVDDRTRPPLPPMTYAYEFFDRDETTDECDGIVTYGAETNKSGTNYIGTVYTIEELAALEPACDYEAVLLRAQRNNWTHVVKNLMGGFSVFKDGDTVEAA